MTAPIRILGAFAGSVLVLAGCYGLRSAARSGEPERPPVDPAVVRVTDARPEGPQRLVSLSVWSPDAAAELPAAPPEDRVEEMRRAAADQGAETLVLERVDLRWRRAFYGFGLARSEVDGAVPDCAHEEAADTVEAVRKKASRCLAGVKAKRPDVSGTVEVVFQVDAFGDVYLAAPAPASSKDGEVQACLLEPVVRADFGDHGELLCRLSISVDVPP